MADEPGGEAPPPLALPPSQPRPAASTQPWRRRVNVSILKKILNIKREAFADAAAAAAGSRLPAHFLDTTAVSALRSLSQPLQATAASHHSSPTCPLSPLPCSAPAAKFLQQRFGWDPLDGPPRMCISVGGQPLLGGAAEGPAAAASAAASPAGSAAAAAAVMEFNKEGRDGFPFKVSFLSMPSWQAGWLGARAALVGTSAALWSPAATSYRPLTPPLLPVPAYLPAPACLPLSCRRAGWR
jgi:hypothetical protein